ncbi:MAG: PTS sugar transporter subunit IIA, partial [Afipia sp.]|nr:PTS sugar transporter subunit IIA [Afipia sp.]
MKISDFLTPADVVIDMRTSQKQQVLQELAGKAATSLGLQADYVASELLKREALGSTGMGNGVAIPHARLPMVKRPHGVLARLKPPINFDAIDGQPVDLIFLLLLPAPP